MKGYIYKYEFPDGSIYIGQTRRDVSIRHKEHINENTGIGNVLLWNKFNKYGINISPIVIEEFESDDMDNLINILNDREIFHISNVPSEMSLNVKPGGGNHGNTSYILSSIFNKEVEKYISIYRDKIESISEKFSDCFEGDIVGLTDDEVNFLVYLEEHSKFVLFKFNEIFRDGNCSVKIDSNFMWKLEYNNIRRWMESIVEVDGEEYAEQYMNCHCEEISKKIESNLRGKMSRVIEVLDKESLTVLKEFNDKDSILEFLGHSKSDMKKTMSNISQVCNFKQNSAYGYLWRYKQQGNH